MPGVWTSLAWMLCSALIVTEGAPAKKEYLIDLNVDLISTQAKEDAFVKKLEEKFQITLIQTLHAGSIRMLRVSATEESAEAVSELAEIVVIEENETAGLAGDVQSKFCSKIAAPETWGLDRIDQTSKPESTNPKYRLATSSEGPYRGAGVAAYIVDTGIDITHPAFGNRAYWGHTVPGMGSDADTDGHGTHVAGTVGAEYYGVAPEVILTAIKVFNDKGERSPWHIIISGLMWVLNDHNDRTTSGTNPKSVVNLSLSGGPNKCADHWIRELIDAGIVVVIAAGNDNSSACGVSPARVTEAITVGASTVRDITAGFSNWGSCVDLYAPGAAIKSTWPVAKGSTRFLYGTSMAAPHVTGVVALKLNKDTVTKTPAQMASWLIDSSTKDKLSFYSVYHATSPNRLLFRDCVLSDV